MRILRGYILREISTSFLACLFILTFLLVSGNVLTKMADLVINWGVDILLLLRLFVFTTPFLFNFTLPVSILVAILLVLGRLSADHEITAMKASGISLRRIIQPVLLAALMLSLLAYVMNDRISSFSHFKVRQLSAEIGIKTPVSILEEGVFIKHFKGIVLFIHRIQGNQLNGVRIYQPQENGPTRTILAEKGEIVTLPEKNRVQLKLMNGTTDEPNLNSPQKFYKLHFDTYYLPLDLSQYKFRAPMAKKTKEMTIADLRKEFDRLKNEHAFIAHELVAEIHRKIAMSFSVLIFAMIGIPLALLTKRSEKSVGLAIALFFSTVYWALLMGCTALAKTGRMSALVCVHAPNVLFGIIALLFIKRLLRT